MSEDIEDKTVNLYPIDYPFETLVIHKPSTSSGGPGEVLPIRGEMH